MSPCPEYRARAERPQLAELPQRWPAPADPRPIVLIGAGGIVNDAHLPAYAALGFEVSGVYDPDDARARVTAEHWGLSRVFDSLSDAAGTPDAIFDVAVPPGVVHDVVTQLPADSACLIQKPLGLDLNDATRIRQTCRARRLTAAVNFQLRFSPMLVALTAALREDLLGQVVELEVHVNVHTPWQLWPFLFELEHMEIAMHSIHYLDTIRHLLGEPRGVWAQTVKHPAARELASTKTSAILDYGDELRCALSVNHHHVHGARFEDSSLRIEGTDGAAVLSMGVNLDYPRGRPDSLEFALASDAIADDAWQAVELCGNWFPDAFGGPMSNLQRFVAGQDEQLLTAVDDAWRTMAVVEACYRSSAKGSTPLPRDPPLQRDLPERERLS